MSCVGTAENYRIEINGRQKRNSGMEGVKHAGGKEEELCWCLGKQASIMQMEQS